MRKISIFVLMAILLIGSNLFTYYKGLEEGIKEGKYLENRRAARLLHGIFEVDEEDGVTKFRYFRVQRDDGSDADN